jgi:hypothetical protein
MNGAKYIRLVVVISLLGLGLLTAREAECHDPAQRAAFIASLPRGETFVNDGETYVWLPTLRAEKKGVGKNALNAGRAVGAVAAAETPVEEKGPYGIYGPPAPASPSQRSAAGITPPHPIALNLRTKSLAIVTGRLWLKLKNMQDTQSIADDYGLVVSFSNPAMETSFYDTPADADIKNLRKRLQEDPRIIRVTLDMMDRIRRPR